MADEDFDIARLADYLHLDASQVSKLADRGKLPGRRVGGAWRFARAEIHHWLEEQIGISDADELARVETALERQQAAASEPAIAISELLESAAVEIPLPARTRTSVISSMVELAARTGWLWDAEKMAEAVRSREDLYPTALENGVALLHPRRPLPAILDRPFLALGRTDRGIPFASSRGFLTDIFFLICSTDDRGHLRTLARLSRLVAEPTFLPALRGVSTPAEALEIVSSHERNLPN